MTGKIDNQQVTTVQSLENRTSYDEDIDLIVGGEYITHAAIRFGETDLRGAKERGWLQAIARAAVREDLTEEQRRSNLRQISSEAIRRNVLTEQQVRGKMAELGLDFDHAVTNNSTDLSERNRNSLAGRIRDIASKLSTANDLTSGEIAADPLLLFLQQQLQQEIDKYKNEEVARGKDEETVRQEIIQMLTESGLRFERQQPKPTTQKPTEQIIEQSGTTLPPLDYRAIAQQFPLDEDNPPKPNQFFPPVQSNMFDEDDEATLSGRMVHSLYQNLIKRTEAKPYQNGEVAQLMTVSEETRDHFFTSVSEVNTMRQANGLPLIEIGVSRQSNKDCFHFNGEPRPSQDFLFYLNKSRDNYKRRREPEVRAYLTIKSEEAARNQQHFVELVMRLYDADIDFSAKACSVFGVRQRSDNMVFYISAPDQPRASMIIKKFLREKKIGHGYILAAHPSPQEGLSWAMEPTPEEIRVWKMISGSTLSTSYNAFVAIKAMPYYLDRLVAAHTQKGDVATAHIYEQEAHRVRTILRKLQTP